MRKMIKYYTLFSILLFVCANEASSVNEFTKAKTYLTNANTYYWYGRSRDNSLFEFEQAKLYCDSALNAINIYDGNDSAVLSQNVSIQGELIKLMETLAYMDTICIDNMNGRYPAYMELMGRCKEYEYRDDPNELAMENAMLKLFQIPYISKSLAERMFRTVIIFTDEDLNLFEVAQQFAAIKTSHYIFGAHEIPALAKVHSIHNNLLTDSILPALSATYNVKEVGVITLHRNDAVNGVYYWLASFALYNPQTKAYTGGVSAEGFRNDKIGVWGKLINRTVLYILLNSLVVIAIFFFIIWYREKKNKYKIEFGYSMAYFFGSFGIAYITIMLLMIPISTIAPISSAFYKVPMSKYLWHLLLMPVSFSIVPITISYFISARFFNLKLKKWQNLFAILIGSELAWPLIYTNNIVLKYIYLPSEYSQLLLFAITSLYIICLLIAWNVYRFGNERWPFAKHIHLLAIVLLAIPIYLLPYMGIQKPVLIFDSFILQVVIFVLFVSGLGLTIFLYYRIKSKRKEKNKEILKDNKIGNVDKNTFNDWISNTVAYVESNDFKINSFIRDHIETSEDQLHIMFGPSGIGKTRFVKEMIKKSKNSNPKIKFFFGDCDQYPDTNNVPYEPFAEGLSEYFEIDFISKDANFANKFGKLLKSIDIGPSKVIGAVMDNSGAGGVANSEELASEIVRYLQMNNVDGESLFILDDSQWMDDLTFDLLSKILKIIKKENINNLNFLLVFRTDKIIRNDNLNTYFERISDSELPKEFDNANILLKDSFSLYPEDFITNLLNDDREKENVVFDEKTKHKLIEYFNKLDLEEHKNPSYYIQMLKSINVNNWFVFENSIISLSEDTKLSELSAPNELGDFYDEMLNKLPKETNYALECAAFIGMTFRANILADVLKLDRVELLRNLAFAEKVGIIKDLRPIDDYFEFSEKILVQELKRKIGAHETNFKSKTKVPQLVKEYHIRIINSILHKISSENNDGKSTYLNINDTSSEIIKDEIFKSDDISTLMALVNYSLVVVDSMPTRVIDIVRAVAKKALVIKRAEVALSFYKNLLKIIELNIEVSEDDIDIKGNLLAYKRINIVGYENNLPFFKVYELLSYELAEYMIRLKRPKNELDKLLDKVDNTISPFLTDHKELEVQLDYYHLLYRFREGSDYEIIVKDIEKINNEIESYLKAKFILLKYRCHSLLKSDMGSEFDEEIQKLPEEVRDELSTEISYRKGYFLKENKPEANVIWVKELSKLNLTNDVDEDYSRIIQNYREENLQSIGLLLDYVARYNTKQEDYLKKVLLGIKIFEYLSDYSSLLRCYKQFSKDLISKKVIDEEKVVRDLKIIFEYFNKIFEENKSEDSIDNIALVLEVFSKFDNLDFSSDYKKLILSRVLDVYKAESKGQKLSYRGHANFYEKINKAYYTKGIEGEVNTNDSFKKIEQLRERYSILNEVKKKFKPIYAIIKILKYPESKKIFERPVKNVKIQLLEPGSLIDNNILGRIKIYIDKFGSEDGIELNKQLAKIEKDYTSLYQELKDKLVDGYSIDLLHRLLKPAVDINSFIQSNSYILEIIDNPDNKLIVKFISIILEEIDQEVYKKEEFLRNINKKLYGKVEMILVKLSPDYLSDSMIINKLAELKVICDKGHILYEDHLKKYNNKKHNK